MHVTCENCENDYNVPEKLFAGEGRPVRCGECGTDWWQKAGQIVRAERLDPARFERGPRTLVIYAGNRWREEDHHFTSFFDGISNRFAARLDEMMGSTSERFQRLNGRHERRMRRDAVVDAEFSEVRESGRLRRALRYWVPRGVVLGLMAASIVIVVLAG